MKVAIVYDRVNKWGGAERVLLALHEIFPDAPLFTSVYSKENAKWAKSFPKVIPSFINKFKIVRNRHELLPYLMPILFESHDFSTYGLVISVTSEAAKGVITKPPTYHICYCLTPTRYLWSHHDVYFKGQSLKGVVRPIVSYLRRWDKVAANRPDVMVAISKTVQDRIKKYYDRESKIIYPPVAPIITTPIRSTVVKEDYFLVVSRLVPYKRVDLAIEAFNQLKLPLVIVGVGSEEMKLKKMAKDNIKFFGQLTDSELAGYYKRCVALVMPQEEDFGLVAVEAQSFGKCVIAFNKGGAREIILPGKTGIFFPKQSVGSLINAIKKFENLPAGRQGTKFESNIIRKNARRFSKERFKKEFLDLVKNLP